MSRALLVAAAALLAGAAIFLALRGEDEKPVRQAAPDAPNFIVVTTDDQALNTWNRKVMPRTFERIVDEGTEFKESFAVPPLCCPSRASFLTGSYPHNHGVLTNNYKALEDPEDVLPVWLDEAGYETMLAGKFLNGYDRVKKSNNGLDPAPGWDEWWSVSRESLKYFDYTVSVDGEPVAYGSDRKDYFTNALTEAAVDFVDERSSDDPPFFLWMAQFAPHFGRRDSQGERCPPRQSPTALPSDLEATKGLRLPKPPNYFERNVNDKPGFIARGPKAPLPNNRLNRRYRCTVASLSAVDRSVERIFKTLEATGQADNTVVFFTSDNGAFLGQHRKKEGKKIPYDPALRVPLAVVAPRGVLETARDPIADTPVGTVDLAPTMLDLAGLEGEHRVDGRSLLSAMRGESNALPPGRGLVVELGRREDDRCTGYLAYRDRAFLYTEYRLMAPDGECGIGDRELYDVRKDPFQLRNLLGVANVDPADEARADALSEKVATLSTCNGIEGRDPPTDAPFCE